MPGPRFHLKQIREGQQDSCHAASDSLQQSAQQLQDKQGARGATFTRSLRHEATSDKDVPGQKASLH